MKKRIFACLYILAVIMLLVPVTVSADDSVKLPKGYVLPEKYFKLEDGIAQTEFSKIDGIALTVTSIFSDGYRYICPSTSGERTDEKATFYDNSNGLLVFEKNGENEDFALHGSYSFSHNGVSYHADSVFQFDFSFDVTATNVHFETYRLVMDFNTKQTGTSLKDGSHTANSPWNKDNTVEDSEGSLYVYEENGEKKLGWYISTIPYGNDGYQNSITIYFKVEGVLPKGQKSSGGITQDANQNAGDDEGVSVPAAIVIGVLGGGAAIAGAAAALSGGTSGGDNKKKSYKMYVQKDFGDAIRRGADPVRIRARMAEVNDVGKESDRNDLTARISASGDGMTVLNTVIAGRYLEATVSVPEEYDRDAASITFTFAGEGGIFTNTVVFRVVDGPSLKFVDERDGTLYHENCGIDAIPGDGFTYTERFMIVDAPVVPKLSDITAVNTGEFDVKFELTDQPALCRMTVKNNTRPDPEHDVFAKPRREEFEIHVVVDGEKEPLKGYVTMNLYPEGITVSSRDEGKKNDVKYVRVQAYEKENVGDLDKKWQVSEVTFTLAVKGNDKAIIDPPEAKYKFEKIKGSDGLGMRADKEQTLAEKYEYKESWGDWNGKFTYDFEPNSNLPEPEDGTFFMVMLPAKCEYDGKTYEADIPLRLRGKDPDPMGDWEKEYRELQRRIVTFSLPENIDKWIAQLKECATEPRASIEEMRLVGKWILREYMEYWTTQQSRDQAEATMYNVIVNTLEWTKFAGDCAFSFLITAYAGPVADALLSPAKDFATSAIGEVIAAVNYGEKLDISIMDRFEFSKNLAAAGDNLVSNAIDLTNWKKAAATLGGYFVYCALKNYILKLNEKGESDIWGSLCDAFKDMTAAALKSKAGDLIGKWLKESKKFQEKIGPKIASWFNETSVKPIQMRLNDALGLEGELRKLAGYANDEIFKVTAEKVVEKYLSGLVGAGFDKLREVYDESKFVIENGSVYYCFNLHLFDALHYGIKLNLTRTLQAMSGDFFGWFYDYFFAGVPVAESVIEKPKDPQLPPAKG